MQQIQFTNRVRKQKQKKQNTLKKKKILHNLDRTSEEILIGNVKEQRNREMWESKSLLDVAKSL